MTIVRLSNAKYGAFIHPNVWQPLAHAFPQLHPSMITTTGDVSLWQASSTQVVDVSNWRFHWVIAGGDRLLTISQFDAVYTPPAPRLVCIETNPGESKSGACVVNVDNCRSCGATFGNPGATMDYPDNSDCGIDCKCVKCTQCWQKMRNEDLVTAYCGKDVSAWLRTHYTPKYAESESAMAKRAGRDVGPKAAFREDLIQWLKVNRDKVVGGLALSLATMTEFAAISNTQVYKLCPDLQLDMFLLMQDDSRYGAMGYETYRALLAEWETISFFTVSCRRLAHKRSVRVHPY
jgi:hypothetical protein